jgi:diaminopimelate decarboxylase
LGINAAGHLVVGGCDTAELARQFGTPLYVLDEEFIRGRCREYADAARQFYGDNALVCYASKAFSCREIYRVIGGEGLGADVVSGGELYTALSAGFPADKIYVHGNNKSERELTEALSAGVHAIVADSFSELELLQELTARLKTRVNVMLRLNPGIEAHTHRFVQTARTDSKFGFAIADGTALRAAETILRGGGGLNFCGLHTHIGSQIFELEPFALAAEALVKLAAQIKAACGADTPELNLGGGIGVRYTAEDKPLPVRDFVRHIAETVKGAVKAAGLPLPRLILEPGRSIVAEAGVTLYTAGAVKDIPGVKKYVCIDGGMFDNPRYALYRSAYEAILANRADDEELETVTLAGKCCESGDIIINEARLARARRGDTVAVFGTGAYNYSMASNYNRNPIPPAVMTLNGKARYIVKPQTYADIAGRDV